MEENMKSKHLLLSAIFAIALFWEISSGTVVKADSFNGASTNSQLTTSQIKQADKYVDVSNNQYVLSDSGKSKLSENTKKVVENQLATVNADIQKNDLVINTETKSLSTPALYVSKAASVKGAARLHSGCYVRAFWWGVRVYFTSNAGVYWFAGKAGNVSTISSLASAIATVTGHEIASTLGEAFGMYVDSFSSQLLNYNKKHKKSKIYTDINYTAGFSFHIYK